MKFRIAIALLVLITSVSLVPANSATKFSVITMAQDSGQTPQERMASIVNTRTDEIKVQSPTRVQAGKSFQVKLVSTKAKINGVCWLNWTLSEGFDIPRDFRMIGGKASVKLLPIEPGAGKMFFWCGAVRNDYALSGSRTIYIAP
jgi:hypothetical protein